MAVKRDIPWGLLAAVLLLMVLLPLAVWSKAEQDKVQQASERGMTGQISEPTLAINPSRQEIDANGAPHYVVMERCALEARTQVYVHTWRGDIAVAEVVSDKPGDNEEACERGDIVRVDRAHLRNLERGPRR